VTFNFLVFSVVALVLHEASHVLMAIALGVRVKSVGLSWLGPNVVREQVTSG